jgi:hypothetical protein
MRLTLVEPFAGTEHLRRRVVVVNLAQVDQVLQRVDTGGNVVPGAVLAIGPDMLAVEESFDAVAAAATEAWDKKSLLKDLHAIHHDEDGQDLAAMRALGDQVKDFLAPFMGGPHPSHAAVTPPPPAGDDVAPPRPVVDVTGSTEPANPEGLARVVTLPATIICRNCKRATADFRRCPHCGSIPVDSETN